MTTQDPSIALGKVEMAIDRLAAKYPLHAGIFAEWTIEEMPAIETMGVGFLGGKLRLVYNTAFVEDTPMEQLVGVVHHEANHVLFEHIFHEPEPDEDPTARLIAEEVTVNEWVPEPLPEGVILLEDYPDLPDLEDTDTRYERLRGQAAKPKARAASAASSDSDDTGDASSSAASGEAPSSDSEDGAEPRVSTVDNHDLWEEIRKNAEEARDAAQMDIAMAWGNLSDEQQKEVDEVFQQIAEEASEDAGMETGMPGIGVCAGSGESELSNGEAQVPWQEKLRRYVGRIMERRPVFGRPPRRYPELVGVIPGQGRFRAKPKVMAVIDTSGSMTDEMLADISAELGVMARTHEVTVVECDVDIHAVYPYRPITSVSGRGGTSFLAPFEPDFLREHKPDLVVYFTDGFGEAPEQPPPMPVIWAITEGGMKPADWGEEIWLKEPE